MLFQSSVFQRPRSCFDLNYKKSINLTVVSYDRIGSLDIWELYCEKKYDESK